MTRNRPGPGPGTGTAHLAPQDGRTPCVHLTTCPCDLRSSQSSALHSHNTHNRTTRTGFVDHITISLSNILKTSLQGDNYPAQKIMAECQGKNNIYYILGCYLFIGNDTDIYFKTNFSIQQQIKIIFLKSKQKQSTQKRYFFTTHSGPHNKIQYHTIQSVCKIVKQG